MLGAIRRRLLPIVMAGALAASISIGLPLTTSFGAHAAASCTYTWTSLQSSTGTTTVSRFTVRSQVFYKLQMNTCNLGVYTEIWLDGYTNTFTITGDTMGWTYATNYSAALTNCSNLSASGCIEYPGPSVYIDQRLFQHTGNGVITRQVYPSGGRYYAYSVHTGVWEELHIADGGTLFMFAFEFLRGDIAHS
jgi:hypothetical protein